MRSRYDYADCVLEADLGFINSQPASDRLHYKRALEGQNAVAGRAKLVAKLYEFCISPTDIDYGKIPDSRGNILKLKGYDTTAKAISTLNDLMTMDSVQNELRILNDFHDMLINCRSDFEYGYRYNIQILQSLYQNMVLSLYELIDMCIVSYSEYLKTAEAKKPVIRPIRKKDTLLLKSVKAYLAAYKNGEWAKMMKALKDPKVAAAGESVFQLDINAAAYSDFARVVGVANEGILDVLAVGGGIIIALYVIFNALRSAIRFFMRMSGKIGGYLETQEELIKGAAEAEAESGYSDEKVTEKRQRFVIKIHSMAEFFNNKILRADRLAEQDIQKENKITYSKEATGITGSNSADFILI